MNNKITISEGQVVGKLVAVSSNFQLERVVLSILSFECSESNFLFSEADFRFVFGWEFFFHSGQLTGS